MYSLIRKNCHYLLSRLHGFCDERSGVVAVLVAFALPVLVGSMGLAAEASYWYVHQRGMQNAADAAAIAAATNGTSTYAAEAQAAAAQDGFQNGSGNVTVAASNTNTASGCTTPAGSACYTVTVSDKVPLFLSLVVGYILRASSPAREVPMFRLISALIFSAIFLCLLAATADARGRIGSHRYGGWNSHGAGSHYYGGHS
jgi:Flp pilus assembly protein TadG